MLKSGEYDILLIEDMSGSGVVLFRNGFGEAIGSLGICM
jgi:hypothetical protein